MVVYFYRVSIQTALASKIPEYVAKSPNAKLPKVYIRKANTWLFVSSKIFSAENAEKVVYPPQIPTTRKSLHGNEAAPKRASEK